ncbi:MAG TPA: DUF3311 domain-containing protein [Vicinamibacterales bacterium]|jgi:hypothetical protein
MPTETPKSAGPQALWIVLFVALFAVALWVPLYNRIDPTLFGVPFFYWFQFVWIIVGGIVTGVAYLCKA